MATTKAQTDERARKRRAGRASRAAQTKQLDQMRETALAHGDRTTLSPHEQRIAAAESAHTIHAAAAVSILDAQEVTRQAFSQRAAAERTYHESVGPAPGVRLDGWYEAAYQGWKAEDDRKQDEPVEAEPEPPRLDDVLDQHVDRIGGIFDWERDR